MVISWATNPAGELPLLLPAGEGAETTLFELPQKHCMHGSRGFF